MSKKILITIVVSISLTMFFACTQKKIEPYVTLSESKITDSIVHKGKTIKAAGVFFVDVSFMISHPRFEKLNEDFGLQPFASIVRQSTYIAVQRNYSTVFVVGGYDANTNNDKMFETYDETFLLNKNKQYTLGIVRYVFAIPDEYRNDKIYLKIFDKGDFGFSSITKSGTIIRSYQEPDDVWFEYEVKQ